VKERVIEVAVLAAVDLIGNVAEVGMERANELGIYAIEAVVLNADVDAAEHEVKARIEALDVAAPCPERGELCEVHTKTLTLAYSEMRVSHFVIAAW
jgi:hypothetical protein